MLPRTSVVQSKVGSKISRNQLKSGDLVFFNTSGKGISHVGMYIGNSKFIHASTSKGVRIDSLNSSYYKSRFVSASRIIK
ncbi:MAG: C40 family peptidase [Romboutsia timonensis]